MVRVKGYMKDDGTYVRGYERREPSCRLPVLKHLSERQLLNRNLKMIDYRLVELRGWQINNPTKEKEEKIKDLEQEKEDLIKEYNEKIKEMKRKRCQ